MQHVKAIYEGGLLRPLEPLDLAQSQEVTVTVSTGADLDESLAACEVEDLEYVASLREKLKDSGPVPSLAEVRDRLSKYPGNWSDDIIAERERTAKPARMVLRHKCACQALSSRGGGRSSRANPYRLP